MKATAILLGILICAAHASAAEVEALKTYEEKVSYGLGVDMARNLKRMGVAVDPDILVQGFRDEFAGERLRMTERELRTVMSTHHDEQERKREEMRKKVAEENRLMGAEFLAENRAKEGVVTLASGLQYRILRPGTGRKPTDEDTVECHFRGTFVNGVEFESTYRRGQPALLKVKGLIPGWAEALKLMAAGAKWQLFIPPELAYGEGGARHVGPNTTVVLEVELIAVR